MPSVSLPSFDVKRFVSALPETTKSIVLDRTKEPGAIGEPLYQDVERHPEASRMAGPNSGRLPRYGGRYGLSSGIYTGDGEGVLISFHPARRNRKLDRINDDVTHTSTYDATTDWI